MIVVMTVMVMVMEARKTRRMSRNQTNTGACRVVATPTVLDLVPLQLQNCGFGTLELH